MQYSYCLSVLIVAMFLLLNSDSVILCSKLHLLTAPRDAIFLHSACVGSPVPFSMVINQFRWFGCVNSRRRYIELSVLRRFAGHFKYILMKMYVNATGNILLLVLDYSLMRLN